MLQIPSISHSRQALLPCAVVYLMNLKIPPKPAIKAILKLKVWIKHQILLNSTFWHVKVFRRHCKQTYSCQIGRRQTAYIEYILKCLFIWQCWGIHICNFAYTVFISIDFSLNSNNLYVQKLDRMGMIDWCKECIFVFLMYYPYTVIFINWIGSFEQGYTY
jgi:hypothetical protein